MPTVTLQAHYDGKSIVLDEPFNLPESVPLLVTVLPSNATVSQDIENEHAWLASAATSEAFDFLDDEREDVYTVADGEPYHPGA